MDPVSEASSTPTTPASEPVESSAQAQPVADAAAPASTVAEAAPDNQVKTQAQVDADWFAKNDLTDSAADKPVKVEATTQTPEPVEPTKPAEPAKATTPEALSVEDLTTIKRYGLDPSAIAPVLMALDPKARTAFLSNVAKRAEHHDALTIQHRTNPQGQQPPAQGQPPVQAPESSAVADHWKKLSDEYGDDYVANFKAAVASDFQAQVAPYQQAIQAMHLRQANDDIDAGFKEIALPEGIDATNPETKAAIIQQAKNLLQVEGYDPVANNFRHAVPKAAASLFAKEILTARGQQARQQQAKNLRSQPTKPGASNKPAPANQAEVDAAWFREHREELANAF